MRRSFVAADWHPDVEKWLSRWRPHPYTNRLRTPEGDSGRCSRRDASIAGPPGPSGGWRLASERRCRSTVHGSRKSRVQTQMVGVGLGVSQSVKFALPRKASHTASVAHVYSIFVMGSQRHLATSSFLLNHEQKALGTPKIRPISKPCSYQSKPRAPQIEGLWCCSRMPTFTCFTSCVFAFCREPALGTVDIAGDSCSLHGVPQVWNDIYMVVSKTRKQVLFCSKWFLKCTPSMVGFSCVQHLPRCPTLT